ncbi:MAG: pyrroloquinoline quinone biosynthesis protein PqqB [Bacteroidia bacterium]|nr:pyrroloquinoline quinone biosynthesis protein PqqB [Bacteroidia bacterium]
MQWLSILIALNFLLISCQHQIGTEETQNRIFSPTSVLVLGVAQDAGFPQANCSKSCCNKYYSGKLTKKMVSSIALIDTINRAYWIIDATPDFPEQLRMIKEVLHGPDYQLAGILLTHAHIGHYTGLMHLGREVMGASKVPVYVMPRMKDFLIKNGPWSQLVSLGNIELLELGDEAILNLSHNLKITPFLVPHRDEFSETVGFKIDGVQSRLLFIPDIDKWEKWDKNILELIHRVDYALLDGSFFANGEIPGRDMSEIPHPFIEESITLFGQLDSTSRKKVGFIHFNHTNPVIDPYSDQYQQVIDRGMWIAREGQIIVL